MILPIPEPFISFSVSHDHVTYDCGLYDHLITGVISLSCFVTYITVIYNIILHSLFKSKII